MTSEFSVNSTRPVARAPDQCGRVIGKPTQSFVVDGIGISQFAGPWLVHQYGLPTWVAIITNIGASILLNFAIRKFFVFKA